MTTQTNTEEKLRNKLKTIQEELLKQGRNTEIVSVGDYQGWRLALFEGCFEININEVLK